MGKRKHLARRAPDGRVIRDEPSAVLGEYRRQAAAARLMSKNPLLGTHIGWLRETRAITPAQHEAGLRIAEVYGRYDRAMGRRRSAASPGYEMGLARGGESGDPDADAEWDRGAVQVYDRLMAALRPLGRRVLELIEALCVEDRRDFVTGDLEDIRAGLDAAADHFGLMGRGRPQKREIVLSRKPAAKICASGALTGVNRLPHPIDAALAALVPDIDAAERVELHHELMARIARARMRSRKRHASD